MAPKRELLIKTDHFSNKSLVELNLRVFLLLPSWHALERGFLIEIDDFSNKSLVGLVWRLSGVADQPPQTLPGLSQEAK